MGIRTTVAGIVLAAGLAGCATDPSGLRYADGSYHPGRDGGGDYYVGRDYGNVRYIGDPWFGDWGWYGGYGYYGFGRDPWRGGWYDDWYGWPGYCPASQRWCGGWGWHGGWGWNDPFPRHGFRIYVDEPSPRPRPRGADGDPRSDGDFAPWQARRNRPAPPPADAPRPAREPREVDADGADREDPFPRARRNPAPRSDASPRLRRSDGN